MRHTKIVATVGPASDNEATLGELVASGVDVFRLNFSHGSHAQHAATVARIRQAAASAGRPVAILQDLSGPKIRTGRLSGGQPVELLEGHEIRIAAGDFAGDENRIATTYPALVQQLHPGDRLLIDDGRIELQVSAASGDEIVATVIDGGQLGEHKGINAPGVRLSADALTSKDEDDLKFGLSIGVDLVGLSFVRRASDVTRAREIATAAGRADVPLIAKLERPEALEHLDEILDACQGVMVARGDLGLEVPLEQVPRIQKEITLRAEALGVPVIVATQVLESMLVESRPTRAEVTDAAHAVDTGVDAIMLAGETAVGRNPVRAVQTLDAIIRDAEIAAPFVPPSIDRGQLADHAQALCDAAVTLATSSRADAIVAVTRAGTTARMLSSLRPRAPIFAMTEQDGLARKLSLLWGVTPVVADEPDAMDAWGAAYGKLLRDRGWLRAGAAVVFISVSTDPSRTDGNFLKFQRLE